MTFMVSDATNYQIENGTVLEWVGSRGGLGVGTEYKAVHDEDHFQTVTIDKMGHLTTVDGRRLSDLVADITVGDQRFGMIYCGVGRRGPRWMVNGPAYDEPFVP